MNRFKLFVLLQLLKKYNFLQIIMKRKLNELGKKIYLIIASLCTLYLWDTHSNGTIILYRKGASICGGTRTVYGSLRGNQCYSLCQRG